MSNASFPEDLPFRTPPDLSSREQQRFAFDRLGDRLDNAWDAIAILREDSITPAATGAIVENANKEISINVGAGLAIVNNQLIVGALSPLTTQSGVLQLILGQGVTTSSGQLTLDVGDGLSFDGSSVVVDVGEGIGFDSGSLTLDFANLSQAPNLGGQFVVFTDSSGNLTRFSAASLWGFGYGNPAGISTNDYQYVNLPFSTYTTPSGFVTQSDWNTLHYAEINAIFLRIIEFIEDLQDTVNANTQALIAKGL